MSDPLATTSLSSLRVFEAAARLGSFTQAAQELGMTQAAVSWQVKALEQRLGQTLFHRRPREVTLTPAGERLSRGATEAMAVLRSALQDVVDTGEGVLAVTTLQSLAAQWLAPRLGSFQLAHPRLAVRLETSGRLVDLARENVDVALRSGPGAWPGLESHFLFPSLMTAVCTPALREAYGLERPDDLKAAPRIGIASEWAIWFEAAGVTPPPEDASVPPRLAADSQVLEIAGALAGHGVALGSPILFSAEIAAGRLVQPLPVTCRMGGDYWLAYPADRRRSRKIVAFRDWLLACVAEDPAIGAYRD